MQIFSYDWVGLFIAGFATLFLIGEVLVNMRGFFGILGLGFIIVYFSVYVEAESLILMLLMYFIGLILIVIDGKLLNDGTLSTIGAATMILSVALPAPSFIAGVYAVLGVMIGAASSFLFLKVFKRRSMWTKLTLKDQLTTEAGYISMNEAYHELLNKEGATITDMRPVGTIQIKGKEYSAITNGYWIPKGTTIRVVEVDGTKILVEQINNE
ncbi:MAG TPA: NfeD family protein [Cerasibacillus sp.]|uniref:NfeD family protein n=1 Tax=Cerasibacillus sp. TaxID=2498711 RepID=UPI002F3FA5F6